MPARVDQRGLLRSETVRFGVFLISADVGSGGDAKFDLRVSVVGKRRQSP